MFSSFVGLFVSLISSLGLGRIVGKKNLCLVDGLCRLSVTRLWTYIFALPSHRPAFDPRAALSKDQSQADYLASIR